MAGRRARNPLDRRADLLAQEMQRREQSMMTKLTDPAPAFMVRVNELDAVRNYLRIRGTPNGLHQLRDQFGDDAVDQYTAWGENALAKYLPRLMGEGGAPDGQDLGPENTENPSFADENETPNLFGPVSAEG